MFSWGDEGQLGTWEVPYAATEASASLAYNTTFDDILAKGGCPDPTRCVLTVAAKNGTEVISENYLYLTPFYDVTTAACKSGNAWECTKFSVVSVTEDAAAPGVYDIKYTVGTVTPFLWLETDVPGHFSDNGMLVTSVAPAVNMIKFFADDPTSATAQALHKDLSSSSVTTGPHVWGLFDTNVQYWASTNEHH